MLTMQERMNRLLGDAHGREQEMEYGTWLPPVNLREEEHAFVIQMEVPGIKKEDIDIHLENNVLTLRGERKFDKEEKAQGYHRIERSFGAFARYFSLPETVDPEKVKAEYKNGVLTVSLAKKELAKPRSIKVEVH
jgi:HSP20 family protein